MNKGHLEYCASPEWAETVRKHIIPGATDGLDLGDHLLEVGPGPGLTTDVLATLVPRLINRVVRPGGAVIGSDSLDSPEFRGFHEGDICTPIPPATLVDRLRAAGFSDIQVETNPFAVNFRARAS